MSEIEATIPDVSMMFRDEPLAQPDWTLFHSSQDSWDAIFALVEEARSSVHLEQYIFHPYGVGSRLLNLLASRARAGVEVKLVIDGFGSSRVPDSPEGKALVKAGGRVVLYNSWDSVLANPAAGLHRLHRKTVLADRMHLIAGGCCFHDRMTDWRDTMVRIEGAPVPSAARAMDALWRRVAERDEAPQEPAHAPPVAPGDWAYMVSTPYKPAHREFYRTLMDALAGARDSITLTTPYFVPDIAFRRALNAALERGVQVRLIIPDPKKNDHPIWNIPARLFAGRLAARGAEIWFYQPAMMHAKIAVVDHDWASVGSTNLDLLSFALNLENGVISRARDFRDALADQLEQDIADSRRLLSFDE